MADARFAATSLLARRSTNLVFFLAALLVAALPALAQVDVTASAGTPNASYTTLKGAFDAINAGTHQGTIGIGISGDTTETATAAINASGAGAAVYTTITIQPTGGASRTISGAITAGSPLIDFNGADNVTIDGLNTGGNSLTIANTTASATAGTSTLRFIGGATSNTVTNANLQGSSSSSVATNGGTVFFSTDAVTAGGNDNNTISNNNIGPAGANLPSKAILCNGTTTTTAIGNSGNVVNNNNIFDYFAAAVTSAGIATNAGCNTWSITNNRLYQTATRTWTTGALHSGINIANTTATSGAQAFTITGNTVGFASNTQTGVYTLTGTGTGAKFTGIQFNGITGGAVSNINNNTVAAVSLTGVTSNGTTNSTPFTGIFIVNGLTISNGNTVGSQSATGSLVYSTTTTTATDVHGIYNFSVDDWTANNNNIGGISVTNLGASGTFILAAFRANTSTAKVFNGASNLVGGTIANSIQLTSTGAASQVLGMSTPNAISTWSSNVVRNLTNNNGTGTGTGASVIGMALTSATPVQTVTQNTISALTNTHATAATTVTGIQFTGATGNLVARNLIHGLTSATTSTAAEINGIRVGGGTTTYRNNMIAIGAGVVNAIGTGVTGGISGIFEPAAGTDSFFHNSVYIGGAPTAGVGSSFAFNSTQVTVARSYRDNVFFNARANAGATGKNYAIRVGGTAPNPAGLTSNNNLLFANGAGAVFGFFNALDVADLTAWKAATGQDNASFSLDPQYNAPAAATPDLHIHPTNVTPIEANGVDVGVTDDFDGQTRASLTPTDIGADAGNFNGVDLSAPAIGYTALGNTSLTTNRTLTVTITDLTGVATGANAPRIYYRKNAGTYFSQACTLATGTVQNGTWNCVINNADMGGVATSDVINYFVIAQDTLGNIASAPPGATATNVNTVTTPPAAPSTYTILTGVAGPIAVGSAETFTSLTNAGGVFEALNARVFTGNVVINVTSDLVAELGTNALNRWSEDGAGGYTLTIRPTGAARTISGAFNGPLIRMNGASRVTIDGSIDGLGTDRSLSITNTSTTTPGVVLFGSVGATPVTDDTLKNTIITNGALTSSAVVISDGATVGNAGFFSNIVIQNNDIRKAFVGVFATGGTTPQGGSNVTYTQNTINSTGANAVRIVGLYMQGVNGATITQNTISNLDKASDENDVGIWLATGTINANVSGNTISALGYSGTGGFGPTGINVTSTLANTGINVSGNTITDMASNGNATGSLARGIAVSGTTSDLTIEKNNISGIINTSTGTFPAYGMDLTGGNNIVVRNNFVSNVSFNMTGGAAFSTQFGIFGIRVAAGTGHKIYNNSVNLDGALPGTAATSLLTAAFGLVATTSTGVDVRDNIFANNITGGTTSIAHVSVYLPAGGTSAMNLTWNNNAYFFGTDAARQGTGQAGTTAGTTFFTTLPALAAYTSTLSGAGTNDNASVASTGAVPFVSSTDLHLLPGSPLATAGVPLPGVTVDIDNQPRSLTTPAIGADEVVADLSITKTDGVTTATAGGSVTYTIVAANAGPAATTATVTDTFPAALTCNWTCSGSGGGTCTAGPIAGNIGDPASLPMGGAVTYTAICSISPSATGSLSNTATVAGTAADPNTVNNTATDVDTLGAVADIAISKTVNNAAPGTGTNVIFTVTATNNGPSNATNVTVNDLLPAGLTLVTPNPSQGSYNGTSGVWTVGSLANGASATLGLTATVTRADSQVNVASKGGADQVDPKASNNSASVRLNGAALIDIQVGQTVNNPVPGIGQPVTFTVTARNAGPATANAVTLTANLPAGLTYNSSSPSQGSYTPASGIWNVGVLAAGATATLTVDMTNTVSTPVTRTVTKTTATEQDLVTGNDSASVVLNPVGNPIDLALTKIATQEPVTDGTNFNYVVTVTNQGSGDATGVTMTDNLPAGVTLVSANPSQGSCSGVTTVTCSLGTIAAGGTATINLVVTKTIGGPVTNTATVTANESDPNTANNTNMSTTTPVELMGFSVD